MIIIIIGKIIKLMIVIIKLMNTNNDGDLDG